jgi:hypothetical protein
VTFGLGKRDRIDSVEVVWPDGRRQAVTDFGPDRVLRIVEPSGP